MVLSGRFRSRIAALSAIAVVSLLAGVPAVGFLGGAPASSTGTLGADVEAPAASFGAPHLADLPAGAPAPESVQTSAPTAPVSFTRNDGQVADDSILYYARAGGVLSGFGAGFARHVIDSGSPDVSPSVVTVSFGDALAKPPLPQEPAPGTRNFFLGSDPTMWQREVQSFGTLVYAETWPDIDLVFRATPEGPKYEVVVRAGADLASVRMLYTGATDLSLTPDGSLVASTLAGPLTDSPPTAASGGATVECSFAKRGPYSVGFTCPGWDGSRTLVIDPLIFSTLFGSSSTDYAYGVQVGSDGTIYVGGYTTSSSFPTTAGAYDTTWNGGYDQYIARFDANGTKLIWSTYIGGSSTDYGYDLYVDSSGDAYLAGASYSTNYPATAGAHDTTRNGSYDATVAKIDSTGSKLLFATYLGGSSSDYGRGVSVGANDTVYVGGYTYSSDFPTTAGAYRTSRPGGYDGFVSRLNQTGALLSSTYLGGSSTDYVHHLRTDANGRPVMTGYTYSFNFPTTSNAEQSSYGGSYDSYVVQFASDLSSIAYSSYLGGGSSDYGYRIAIGPGGAAYITGMTYSSNFPTKGNSFSSSLAGGTDAFLAVFDLSTGDLDYSSYFGGGSYDYGYGVAVNNQGEAYLTGYTQSTDFPTTAAAFQSDRAGGYDAYILRLNSAGDKLIYGSYLGGTRSDYGYSIATDANSTAYIAGRTYSSNFPTTPGAYDTTLSSNDGFLTKLDPRLPRLTLNSEPPGLRLVVQNDNRTTPYTEECWTIRRVYAPSPQYDGDTRYVFDRWSDGGTQLHALDCTKADVTVTAYFKTEYRVDISTSPPGLHVSVDGKDIQTPVTYWWENGTYHRLDVVPTFTTEGVRYTFDQWSNGSVGQFNYTAIAPLDIVAEYAISHYLFKAVTHKPMTYITFDGNRYAGPISEWLAVGSNHTLAAPESVAEGTAARHLFLSWSDGGPMVRPFTVSEPLDLVAEFYSEYLTSFETNPPEIAIKIDEVETPTPHSVWWREGDSHRINGPVDEVELYDTRYRIAGWVDSYASERLVYADGPITYTALFTASSYRITVQSVPPGLNVVIDRATHTAPAVLWWTKGSDHTVQAVSPQLGDRERYVFSGWSDHMQFTHMVTATAPGQLTARYLTEYEFIIDTNPTGLNVIVDGAAQEAPYTTWWSKGQYHDIGVPASQAVGGDQRWDYASWSDEGGRIHSVTAEAPMLYTASFDPSFLLTIISQHQPPPCDVDDCWYRGGETATPHVDSPKNASVGVRFVFAGWVGDYVSDEVDALILMDGPKTVTVAWQLEYKLTVVSEWGEATGAGWYAQGESASIGLGATDWQEGDREYTFSGWTGAIATQSALAQVQMGAPKTATAVWDEVKAEAPPPPPPDTGGDGGGGGESSMPVEVLAGVGAAVAVAALIGLLALRRRTPRDGEVEAELSAPVAPVGDIEVPAALPAAPPAAPLTAVPALRPVRRMPQKRPAAQEPRAEASPARCRNCNEPAQAAWTVCPFCETRLNGE